MSDLLVWLGHGITYNELNNLFEVGAVPEPPRRKGGWRRFTEDEAEAIRQALIAAGRIRVIGGTANAAD
jgi:hypothetical protein